MMIFHVGDLMLCSRTGAGSQLRAEKYTCIFTPSLQFLIIFMNGLGL